VLLAASTGAAYLAWDYPARRASAEARRALAAGRYDDAWVAAARWVALRPSSGEAQWTRARAAIAVNRPRDIFEGMKRARALGFPADRLAVLDSLLDAQRGRVTQALPVLAKAFETARTPDPMLDEALARLYLETYDFPHAAEVLTRWADDAPDDARPPLWRASVRRRQGAKPEVVITDFREALRRDPDLAEARLGLADELTKARRHEEAATEYAAYLALKPDHPAGLLGAGKNARGMGDLDEAVRRLNQVLALDPPNAEAHQELAQISRRQGDEAAALRHLDAAIAAKPYNPELRYSRKLSLTRLGRRAEADTEQKAIDRLKADLAQADALQAELKKTPRDVNLQYLLARWMFDHGYDQEGVTWSRRVLVEHPGHPATCTLLADHFDRAGDPAQAAAYRAQSRR
jgi:tetratricopeptide (TPR) repeat protein